MSGTFHGEGMILTEPGQPAPSWQSAADQRAAVPSGRSSRRRSSSRFRRPAPESRRGVRGTTAARQEWPPPLLAEPEKNIHSCKILEASVQCRSTNLSHLRTLRDSLRSNDEVLHQLTRSREREGEELRATMLHQHVARVLE